MKVSRHKAPPTPVPEDTIVIELTVSQAQDLRQAIVWNGHSGHIRSVFIQKLDRELAANVFD